MNDSSSYITIENPILKGKLLSFSRKRHRTSTKPLSNVKTLPKSKSKTRKAADKIQRFFKRTETPRKLAFLKAVCSDSGECVMFGKEIRNIKRVFNEFKLKYVDSLRVRRIGGVSANGFVVELPFMREGYRVYTVLKSSIKPDADNLFYEAFVGIFINKKHVLYPCFVETYASYFYEDKDIYEKFKRRNFVKKDEFINGIVENAPLTYKSLLNTSLISKSCEQSQYFSVLIQHINGASSIGDHVNSLKGDTDFISVHLVCYLFQIYCPLAAMANDFTHYDLHDGNVLIYTPSVCKEDEVISYDSTDKYVRMIYHYSDESTVEFNTFGIAKIIDYGRSYMNDRESHVTPRNFYYNLCKEDKCNYYEDVRENDVDSNRANSKKVLVSNCGEYYGYSILDKENPYGSFHYISSQKRNKSHDLRLVNIIWQTKDKSREAVTNPIRSIMANMVYEDKFSLKTYKFDHGFGTPEVHEVTYKNPGDKIKNVEDLHLALKYLIKNEEYFALENERIFQGKTKMGEMHIWVNGSKPMEYIAEP
jgi:hypothetical protein